MREHILFSFLCLGVATLAPAYAQTAKPQTPITIQQVDANGDGTVTPQEARLYLDALDRKHLEDTARKKREAEEEAARRQAAMTAPPPAPAAYHPADTNRDGIISPEEQAAYIALTRKTPPATQPVIMNPAVPPNLSEKDQKRFAHRVDEMRALDKNADGVLQATELQEGNQTRFDGADTNKDGVLSQQEISQSLDQMRAQKQDAYSNAVMSREANRLKQRLNRSDADNDGTVSVDEYNTYMKTLQQNYDRDGNGIISPDEYRTDGEKLPDSYRKPAAKN